MLGLLRNVRFSLRLLAKNKGFTAIAVLALALGIGPNTAIFSVIYATLLAPMPYPEPDQLVMVWSRIQGFRNGVAAGDYLDWRRDSRSFQGLWAFTGFSANLGGAEGPEQVPGQQATPGMISGMGVRPLLGRDFLPEEAQPGRNKVAILMHKLWMRRFGGRADIVGSRVRINGEQYTVVGVLPPGQQDRMPNQLWVPLSFQPDQINHDFHWLLVMGRLKRGVTIQQAQADMDVVAKQIARVYPANKGWGVRIDPLKNDFVAQETITTLWLLMGGVGFVLLIACANLANLLLARGTVRQREVAIRASLGASRLRLFGQLLTESVVLAGMGGALGVGLGWGILKAILAYMPADSLPSEADVRLNVPVLLFTLAATMLAGVLAGCAPAWQAARQNLSDTLKQSGRALGAGRHWLRRVLVVSEFALAVTLLAGAGLAIHSFLNLRGLDLGFRSDHILTFELPMPQGRLTEPNQLRSFYRDLLARIEAVPGITSATVGTGMPIRGAGFGMPFSIAGKPVTDPSSRPGAGFQMVTPGYFQTFGVKLVRGRYIDEHDVQGGVRVAMVDESFVNRYLKGMDPLRQRLLVEELIPGVTRLGPPVEWQIVGVFHTIQVGGRPNPRFASIYVPFWQSPWPAVAGAVRTSGDPAAMANGIAAAVHALDPDLPVGSTLTMEQMIDESRVGDRFGMALFGGFAAVALLLAALGIYGVMSFLVEQRTHEIGLRMALGAQRAQVLRLVVSEGMVLAGAGLALGLVGAWLVGRAMTSLLYGVAALDYGVFAAISAVLLAAALVACSVPARRAAWVDPLTALRQD
jgi:putative ABC transport system permease protein